MISRSSDSSMQLVTLGIQQGEMLLEAIQEGIDKEGIRNGVVVSGIGTLKNFHMHYICHTGFPPDNEFVNIEKPLELLSVSGIIADGKPHLHAVVSCGKEEVYAGHLEDKCEVAYLAEIAILRCDSLEMCRRLDEERQVSLLGPKDP